MLENVTPYGHILSRGWNVLRKRYVDVKTRFLSTETDSPQDLTQRMMLATWLVEFYLSKCNELDDIVAAESVSQDVDNLQTERDMLEDDLRQFFETYKVSRYVVHELRSL